MAENVAALTSQRFQGGLGGRFKITDDLTVSAGLTGEISQRSISSTIFDDEFYQPGDLIVEGNNDGSRFFDATFGVFAQLGSTYAGVSLPNLVTAKLSDIRLATDSSTN
ncbi:MAG: type IX secretion system membrane protein PorP/SprF, partial [Saprospiraceae bacterium]|nr:type IX secretion system membrane protein PorP/SprF [Saprospiraceae bacterium]